MEQSKGLYDKEKRRIFIILLGLVVLLLWIAGRLFWIQAVSARSYSSREVDLVRNSVLQRQKALVLDSGRGHFYDRNMIPLTGERIKALVAFPVKGDILVEDGRIASLAHLLGTSTGQWNSFMKELKGPRLWSYGAEGPPIPLQDQQIERITAMNLPYVRVVDVQIRYPDKLAAAQLIGFIGQNPQRIMSTFAAQYASGELKLTSEIGGSGLEKTFEPWLRGVGETSVSYFTDASKRPLEGLDSRLIEPDNDYYPLKVVTTLDVTLQRSIEELMEKMNIAQGAAVVLNAGNADVLAMASRPSYNPGMIDLKTANWSNHAVKAIPPGSIFKTVTAAAALEEGVVKPNETFDCQGALGKYGLTCWKKEGHGHLTLEEGFAESCNIVFAQIMKRLSASQLEDYAHRLGLLTEVGWRGEGGLNESIRQVDGEEAGQLFSTLTPREDEGVRLQTAIGQRDVLVSPLQAANMIVTLLHNGERYSPRVAQEVRFRTNQVMERFPVHKLHASERGILPDTSHKLLTWMEDVVEDGTGKGLQGARWKLAGKSGTAQVTVKHEEKVNQWFIGYGPAETPKYAVSVVVEHAGTHDANKAVALYKGIMDLLAEADESHG